MSKIKLEPNEKYRKAIFFFKEYFFFICGISTKCAFYELLLFMDIATKIE